MVFVDTGPFLARYLKLDEYHARAVGLWEKLHKTHTPCTTSNFILDEFFTLLARRAGNHFAAETARIVYESKAIQILRPDAEDEIQALDYFGKYADHQISYTDCISFALIRRYKFKKVFTFDSHFEYSGCRLFK